MELYYRVHWRDCPPFAPENAKSIDWSLRGQDTPCPRCQGEGFIVRADYEETCPECDGACVVEARPVEGYSCCESIEKLDAYFSARIIPDDPEVVIEFSGRLVGWGTDNEPLVVPDMHHVKYTTWGEIFPVE